MASADRHPSILWDTGIIGLLAVVSFAAAFYAAFSIFRYRSITGIFRGLKAAILRRPHALSQ
jgi:NO-binding membrane sensor protein with MHYT domain